MEGNEMNLFTDILNGLQLENQQKQEYSPLVLAYIGDGLYELAIRTSVISRGNASVDVLNRKATFWAKAVTQGKMARLLMEQALTEEEIRILKRGRNAHPASTARRASIAEYHMATGLESLIGWLYVHDQTERALELIRQGMALLEKAQKKL